MWPRSSEESSVVRGGLLGGGGQGGGRPGGGTAGSKARRQGTAWLVEACQGDLLGCLAEGRGQEELSGAGGTGGGWGERQAWCLAMVRTRSLKGALSRAMASDMFLSSLGSV